MIGRPFPISRKNELAAIAVLGYMHEWKECQGEKHFLHDAAFGKHMPQEWLLPIR